MKQFGTRKLCYAGILCAVAVVGSFFYIPVFGSKCVPVQHMVNILCAVLLGPFYGGLLYTSRCGEETGETPVERDFAQIDKL